MAIVEAEQVDSHHSHHELPHSVEKLQGGLVYLIPTVHWLHDMTQKYKGKDYKGPDFTLGSVPDAEWISLRNNGVDLIYFMGVFQRDEEARKFAHRWTHEYVGASPPDFDPQQDILGSAFANVGYGHLDRHVVDPDKDWQEFDEVARKLERLGIGVGVDYIPNHTGIGHPRVGNDHHFYVRGTRDEFLQAPHRFIDTFLGDMGADRPFFDENGKEYHIYHGWYEGADFPWEDTAQINLTDKDTQETMIREVEQMVRDHHLSMLRFDMVHLTLRSTFERSWGWKYTEEQLKTLETFWPRLIKRAKDTAASQGRELICIAEAYWGEGEILNAGFDFVYGSEFYNREHAVAKGEQTAESVAWYLTNGWERRRTIGYQENHDEHRAASNEGLRGDAQSRAFATISAMSDEGMWMVFAGQEEARITRPPAHTRRTRDELGDEQRVNFNTSYYNRLFSWRQSGLFRKGVYSVPHHKPEKDDSYKQLVVQQKITADEGRISVVNLSNNNYGTCFVQLPANIDVDSLEVYEWNTGERVLPIATPLRRSDDPNHLYLSVMIRGPWRGQYITFKKK